MVKKLLCVSSGSLKRFPHTFTTSSYVALVCNKGIKETSLVICSNSQLAGLS